MPAADPPVHRGSSLCMKRNGFSPISPVVGKTGGDLNRSGLPLGFQQIPDFRQQLHVGGGLRHRLGHGFLLAPAFAECAARLAVERAGATVFEPAGAPA